MSRGRSARRRHPAHAAPGTATTRTAAARRHPRFTATGSPASSRAGLEAEQPDPSGRDDASLLVARHRFPELAAPPARDRRRADRDLAGRARRARSWCGSRARRPSVRAPSRRGRRPSSTRSRRRCSARRRARCRTAGGGARSTSYSATTSSRDARTMRSPRTWSQPASGGHGAGERTRRPSPPLSRVRPARPRAAQQGIARIARHVLDEGQGGCHGPDRFRGQCREEALRRWDAAAAADRDPDVLSKRSSALEKRDQVARPPVEA